MRPIQSSLAPSGLAKLYLFVFSSKVTPGVSLTSFSKRLNVRTQSLNKQPNPQIMNTIAICFNTDGTAHCLWTEAVPLHEVGRLEIKRASTIEFNNQTQQWEVRQPKASRVSKGKVLFFARSRAVCLAWEHEHFNGPD
jgi:hypothetical protein